MLVLYIFNIPPEDGLVAIRKALDERGDKTVLTYSLIEVAKMCFEKEDI